MKRRNGDHKQKFLIFSTEMVWIILLLLLPVTVTGESFRGKFGHGVQRHRIFEAPDVAGTGMVPDTSGQSGLVDVPQLSEWSDTLEVPELSEWYHSDYPELSGIDHHDLQQGLEWKNNDTEIQRRLIMIGGYSSHLKVRTNEVSEVTSMLIEVCRKCMVGGNIDCVSRMCFIQASKDTGAIESEDMKHQAFATGTTLHADILCSLCKHTRDASCATRLCANPDIDTIARESGVECMGGFCRWQKETVKTTGYNNYYQAWWQPQSLYLWFDHVTKELSDTYQSFYTATNTVLNVFG